MTTRRAGALLLVLMLGVPACTTASPTPDAPSPSPSPSPALPSVPPPSEVAASTTPTAVEGPSSRPIADDPGPVALEVVTEGLASPVGFAAVPDGSLLAHERGGRVVSIDPATGEQSVFLDLSDRILAGGEQGLLGLVLHPGWPAVAEAIVHYTDPAGDTVVSIITAPEGAEPRLDPATERVILRVDQPFANHNGGQLAFGPDGMLYLGLGDGGSGGDPRGHGQDATTLLGSILRLDVLGAAEGEPYAIPPDNPFADGTGGAPEIFAYGLRNPWRFSFDPATGELWIADVGQGSWEEVDRIDPETDAGANLGWNLMEGTHCFAEDACSGEGLLLPVTAYDHGAGCSVTGGEVYRGSAIPALWGWYVFSDFCSGALFGVPADVEAPAAGEAAAAPRVLLETDASVSAFGVGSDGELYLADIGRGIIYRIVGG